MLSTKKNRPAIAQQQQGFVLVMGLIMMLLLTIIGLAAIRGSGMQELMAGNIKDRNMAFQAAEASLREAEALINDNIAKCGTFTGAEGCYLDRNIVKPVIAWTDNEWAAGSAEASIVLSVAKKPRYVIEQITTVAVVSSASGGCSEFGCEDAGVNNMTTYRVTSIGYGGSESAQVMLQSTYRHGSI